MTEIAGGFGRLPHARWNASKRMPTSKRSRRSHVEADAQDVAVRHHVVLSFKLQLPGLARRML